jgi:hypothetical protein
MEAEKIIQTIVYFYLNIFLRTFPFIRWIIDPNIIFLIIIFGYGKYSGLIEKWVSLILFKHSNVSINIIILIAILPTLPFLAILVLIAVMAV